MSDEQELDGYWKDVKPDVPPDPAADYDARLVLAVACYRRRKAHKAPEGRLDSHGRWYPSEKEHQECCRGVRPPSHQYPWSLYHHCKTGGHIANLYGVREADLRAALKKPAQHRPRVKKSGPTQWDKLTQEDDDEVGRGQGTRAA